MSGVFARSCSHCSAKVVLRRKKRKEEGDAGEARRDPQALLPTETVVVTPGAVQLETRSPFSDVTGRCIRQGHPSLPCVAPSRSHLRPSSPLVSAPRPATAPGCPSRAPPCNRTDFMIEIPGFPPTDLVTCLHGTACLRVCFIRCREQRLWRDDDGLWD